jgi:hypothetical protein
MDKDASLFMWLDEAKGRKIYVVDDFSLGVVDQGDVSFIHWNIVEVYHVLNISANMLFISQITQTCNILKFWPDRFDVHDLKKGKSIVVGGLLDSMEISHKVCDMTQPEPEPTVLVSHTYE